MKKIALIGYLSLYGASMLAMVAPGYSELLREALNDSTKVQAFTDAVIKDRIDIDSYVNQYAPKMSYADFLNSRKKKSAALEKTADTIFAALSAHRSHPEGEDDLAPLVADAMGDATKLAALEKFLEDKSFNIDLILFDPLNSSETIGEKLDALRSDENVRNILHLPRIDGFRYKDTSLDKMRDFYNATLKGADCYDAFAKLYTDRATRKASVDVDFLPSRDGSLEIMADRLYKILKEKDDKTAALQIAERVQADRTNKESTVRALFKAVTDNPDHLDYLTTWLEKFPVDVDTIDYDKSGYKLGEALKDLVESSDDATKKAGIALAEVVRPHRAAEMKIFRDLLAAYKKDKTQLAGLKDWFEKNPFDVDVVALDPAQPKGETLGSSINALKDDALSGIFKDKRTKRPAATSWITKRKLFIAAGAAVLGWYVWHKKHSQKEEGTETLPVLK